MTNQTQKIRELNDAFRQGCQSVTCQIVITRSIADLLEESETAPENLMHMVRNYDNFTEKNDSHDEHHSGSFELAGYPCFWKIDYYDPTLRWGSENGADISKTRRVLTVMLADEF